MEKLVATASEIAKRGTFHAYHHRVAEACYLYKLSVTFIDKVLEEQQRLQTPSSATTVQFLRDARQRYLSYVDAHPNASPHAPPPASAAAAAAPPVPPAPTVHSAPPLPAQQPLQPAQAPPPQLRPQPQPQPNPQHRPQPQPPPAADIRRTMSASVPPRPGPQTVAAAAAVTRSAAIPVPAPIAANAAARGRPIPLGRSGSSGVLVGSAPPPSQMQQQQAAGSFRPLLRSSSGSLPSSPPPPPLVVTASAPAEGALKCLKELLASQPKPGSEDPAASAIRRADEAKRAGNLGEAVRLYECAVDVLLASHIPPPTSPPPPAASTPSPTQDRKSPAPSPHAARRCSTLRHPLPSSASTPGDAALDSLKATLAMPQNLATIDFANDPVELHERLGGGGSGAMVLRATSRGFTFAAKVLTAEMPPEVTEQILWEIVVLSKLDHPNVAKYLGHDLSRSGKISLYMEYYTSTLSRILAKRKEEERHLTVQEVTNWAFQIAKGLSYLHNLDPPIIHRDLKSDNVFVLYDTQDRVETLKIGDFDTAKIIEAAKVTFTRNVGTVGFQAPECCAPGEKGYSEKADIWSFGMVLYEMMMLETPYYEVHPLQRYDLQSRGERPVLNLGDRAGPLKHMVDLFERCTAKNPSQRPVAKKIVKIIASCL